MGDFFAGLGAGFSFPDTQMNSGPLPSVGAGAPAGANGNPNVAPVAAENVFWGQSLHLSRPVCSGAHVHLVLPATDVSIDKHDTQV